MSGAVSKKACLDCDYPCNIGYIEDILVNILSKLPVDSALECKLVSKFWYRLIREPQFAQLQFNCSPKNPKLILYLGDNDSKPRKSLHLMDTDAKISRYTFLPDVEPNCYLKFMCSFAGLVFCTKSVGNNELEIQIFNPANRRVRKLPRGSRFTLTQSIGLLFELDRHRYKVLRFFRHAYESEDSIKCNIEAYTPDSGEWRRISGSVQCPVANPTCPLFPTHICVGGRMYWLVWSEKDPDVPDYILSIGMDDKITGLELPDDPSGLNILTFLTEYEGRLTCVCVDSDELYVDIWSLKDHVKPSWSYEGYAALKMDGDLEGINSIVPIGNELLFIIKPGISTTFRFHFLNVAEMTWRKFNSEKFGRFEPVALPFAESLFRCDTGIDAQGQDLDGSEK